MPKKLQKATEISLFNVEIVYIIFGFSYIIHILNEHYPFPSALPDTSFSYPLPSAFPCAFPCCLTYPLQAATVN